jgi:hypothetical protein
MKILPIIVLAFSLTTFSGSAQILCKEGFAGLTTEQVGLSGSGTDATGWTISSWQAGVDARYKVVNPVPEITHQVAGGGLVSGGDRALLITTFPEPVPAGLAAYRDFPIQNTTLYISFLIRPKSIGTGSDSLNIRIGNNSVGLVRLAFKPDQAQRWISMDIERDSGNGFSGGGSSKSLLLEQTYMVVLRITRPSSTSIRMEYWVDPTGEYFEGPVYSGLVSGLLDSSFNRLSIPIISSDSGGPATSVILDQLRLGYTWQDVVEQRPVPATIPTLSINTAVDLRWQTEVGKSYQPQYSFDLNTWINLGPIISGNGQIKQVYDSTGGVPGKFFRVQIK